MTKFTQVLSSGVEIHTQDFFKIELMALITIK